jgi:hypothetical protein
VVAYVTSGVVAYVTSGLVADVTSGVVAYVTSGLVAYVTSSVVADVTSGMVAGDCRLLLLRRISGRVVGLGFRLRLSGSLFFVGVGVDAGGLFGNFFAAATLTRKLINFIWH